MILKFYISSAWCLDHNLLTDLERIIVVLPVDHDLNLCYLTFSTILNLIKAINTLSEVIWQTVPLIQYLFYCRWVSEAYCSGSCNTSDFQGK